MLNAQQLIELLKSKFGNNIISIEEKVKDKVYCHIKKESVVDVARYVFEELKARFLISAGTDRRKDYNDFLVSHIFSFDEDKLFLTLHIPLKEDDPVIPSITQVIPGANWAEREFYDMVGIKTEGHPDPRRLALPDDWPENLHPLRRDFKYDTRPEPVENARPKMKEPPPRATVVPVGPFFPVLEEPSQWRVFVEGETVVGCDYRGFYNHRGIEKLGDSHLTYNKVPFIAERICGICGFIHSSNYCQAVEEAAGIEVPLRAKYIRSLMLELERIHSHILWLGIAGHILGFDTVLHQAWRIREPVMWLCERISGARKSYGLNIVGGVRYDIQREKYPDILNVLDRVEKEWMEVIDAISEDTPLMMRLKGVGVLTNEVARKVCVTGPTARGSGVAIDSRVDHPYAAYEFIEPKKIVHSDGDVLARTLVRLEETLDSIKQVRRCIKDIPDGPIVAKIDENLPPYKEGISVVEAPRGEAIHYVITGEENRPYRWRVRAPTYPNLQAIPFMIQNLPLADVPITLGSIDPCFSCTERLEVVDLKKGDVKMYTKDELLEISRSKNKLKYK